MHTRTEVFTLVIKSSPMKNIISVLEREHLQKIFLGLFILIIMNIPGVAKAQVLETETARFLAPGGFQAGNAFEFQTSSQGKEYAVPFAYEVGLTKRFTLLVEPVAFTQISPAYVNDSNPVSLGIGDLESTLEYLIVNEKKILPAIAVGFEVKFPTASNRFIGTGKSDFAVYLIASKRIKSFDFHGNFIYNINGSPVGLTLKNTYEGRLAAEYFFGKAELFGELIGVSSSVPGEGGAEPGPGAVFTPEAPTAEFTASGGFGFKFKPGLLASIGVVYFNNNAILFRPGLTMNF